RSVFPEHLRDRLEVIHDGIDTSLWCRTDQGPQGRSVQGETIPDGTSIVTYVARGLEAMRGFDVFVRTAKEILMERPETIFVVVGGERTHYGNDRHHIDAKSFCQHVLAEEQPDLNRFRFLGTLPPAELARVLSVSDLHIYLTVPFVLSWSLLNAMACACPVLASETGPVSEVVRDGYHGRLAPFADHIALGRVALELLEDRQQAAKLAEGGRALVEARYSLDATYPRLCDLFARAMGRAELLPGH
ncbi:MAG: glycosyltransferase, partial [Planctomycetota bacterium]|nr:glycosyltransferase [Planctomycetota bacterium]